MNKKFFFYSAIFSASLALLLYFGLPILKNYLHEREKEKIKNNYLFLTSYLIHNYFQKENLHEQMYFVYLPNLNIQKLYHSFPGTIFIHTDNIPYKKNGKADLAELKKRIETIKKYYHKNGYPEPFFAIDQEGGTIRWLRDGTTPFPWALALGEANAVSKDLPLTYLTAYHNCRELKQYGINWVLGPVADIIYDLNNPAIHARSFGNDKKHVIKNVREYLKGLNDAGCMNALKHFPGHGDTDIDSHFDLPIIRKNFKTLEKEDLSPFISTMNDNLNQGIMTSHILFSEIDHLPVPISKRWLKNIIRHNYKYKGIIVTDDIGMDAMRPPRWTASYSDLILKSIEAGSDMVLMFKDSPFYYKNAIRQTNNIINKRQNLKRKTQESVRRIIHIKLQKGLFDKNLLQIRAATKNAETIEAINYYFQHTEKRRQSIEKNPALKISAARVKKRTCQKAIKRVWGKGSAAENNKPKVYCITDSTTTSRGKCSKISMTKNGIPYKQISQCKNDKQCLLALINLKGKNTRFIFRSILSLRKRPNAIFYTTDTMLPFSYWKAAIRKEDTIITSFNNDEDSKKALSDCFTQLCTSHQSKLQLETKN